MSNLFKELKDKFDAVDPNEAARHAENAEHLSADEAQALLEKYDRESNIRVWDGIPRRVIRYMLVAFALYCVLINLVFNWETRIERASFVGCLVFLIFLVFPATKNGKKRVNHVPWFDLVLAVIGGFAYFYFVANCTEIINQGIKLNTFQIVLGAAGVLVTLEACRRAVGLPIVVVSSLFIIYALTQKSLKLNIYNIFYTAEGVIGTPIRACSTFIVLFVIFGSFLERTGISNFFIEMANSIAGSSSGGPAKVAVISSALCGMVSGSSVGNTVTTGSVTIPMMKRTGYKPEFAGAVEATSSTGGQIMPPIMGAAAFLMIDFLGQPYSKIIVYAIIPAILYFAGIFIAVHLEAKKVGLKGIPRSELPSFWKLQRSIYLLIPLVVLVVLVSTNTYTMAFSASVAIVLAIFVGLFEICRTTIKAPAPAEGSKGGVIVKETGFMIFNSLANGGKSCISIIAACAMAGCVAGSITMTGLGSQLIGAVTGLAGNVKFVALFLTMLCCIVLGMGVPTTANFCIMATTCAPILIDPAIGIDPVAAYFFVFYFGIVADITPPVALAAYAGSAIAKSNPMKTALTATRLAIAAFIVPYVFAYSPSLLLVDTTVPEAIQVAITSMIGIFGVATALCGHLYKKVNWFFRFLLAAGGLTLIIPGTLTDIIGIVLVGGVVVYQKLSSKSAQTPKAA